MKQYTITKESFINWMFNTGADQEQRQMRVDIGYKAVEKLLEDNSFTITVEDVWNSCDHCCIQVSYLEDCEEEDGELMDLDHEYEVKLID